MFPISRQGDVQLTVSFTLRTIRMATLLRIHVILSFFTAICAWEAHRNAKILTGNDEIGGGYDYVIAGGGTAGLTVADRLSADGKCMPVQSN